MHTLRSRRQRTRAQSMVEFALVVPFLLLFILGIIELGYALFVYTSVQNAAREGARSAAVRPCPTGADTVAIQNATRSRLPALVDTNLIMPAIVYSDSSKDFGTAVTVTVSYSFQLLDPLVQHYIPQVNVNAVASRSITTGCNSVLVSVPTLTPINTSTPGPSPTATDTSTPGPSPTATATSVPTATPCMRTVPNLVGLPTNGNPNAADAWAAAGFTGDVNKHENSNWTIQSQSLPAGSSQPCSSSITVHDHP
jgi:Flp pilus assembly protein TadG